MSKISNYANSLNVINENENNFTTELFKNCKILIVTLNISPTVLTPLQRTSSDVNHARAAL